MKGTLKKNFPQKVLTVPVVVSFQCELSFMS